MTTGPSRPPDGGAGITLQWDSRINPQDDAMYRVYPREWVRWPARLAARLL